MASFKAKFPVLQVLFAKNHRGGPFGPPAQRGAGNNLCRLWRYGCKRVKFSYHLGDVSDECYVCP